MNDRGKLVPIDDHFTFTIANRTKDVIKGTKRC